MKPEPEVKDDKTDNSSSVAGDVIGDTAYSQRFVLKLLLKLANLNTIKDEVRGKSFEDDLCTLWDMTTERDVVLFLQKHDTLNLFNFALPVIEYPRIIEIILGVIGNMCCQKEAVEVLLKMDNFLTFLIDYMKSDDSLILIQVLRFVNSSLFLANENDICVWMEVFEKIGFSSALYFILKNSSNKDLIVTALESFNTICSYCNIHRYRTKFFSHFVTSEAMESLCTAFTEISNQKNAYEREDLERILLISLQITLNFIGFDKSVEIYIDNKKDVSYMISFILSYYENKLNQKEIDADLIDIIDSTSSILNALQISETCGLDIYFTQSVSMWKTLKAIKNSDQNNSSFEEDDKEDLQEITKQIAMPLSTLICTYINKCADSDLLKAFDEICEDYADIIKFVDKEMQLSVSKRTANYRTRLKDNVDSQ